MYKDSKTIKREHEAWLSEREREATDKAVRPRVQNLKTMEVRRRFRNEEAKARSDLGSLLGHGLPGSISLSKAR